MSKLGTFIGSLLLTLSIVAILPERSNAQACLLGFPAGCCLGDCDGNGQVSAGEATKIVAIVLNCNRKAAGCPAVAGGMPCINADRNGDGDISAGEYTLIISNAINFPPPVFGCPPRTPVSPTNTPTGVVADSPTPTPTNPPVNTPTNTPVPTAINTSTPTTTFSNTPKPPDTPTATPSFTATTAVSGFTCGNGVTEPGLGETCDDGGTCVGGSNAGTACTSDAVCQGQNVCLGIAPGKACSSDADCLLGARCGKCAPHGGDGCAVNCTSEIKIPIALVKGTPISNPAPTPLAFTAGTSGAIISGGVGTPRLALPLSGSQAYIIGAMHNNVVPFVQKATDSVLPQIAVSFIACACVRAVPVKTCGGTIFDPDGVTQTKDCSDRFTQGVCSFVGTPTPTAGPGTPAPGGKSCFIDLDCSIPNPTPVTNQPHCIVQGDPCAGTGKPCAFVHGPGNSSAGLISCDPNIPSIDLTVSQNAGSSTYAPTPPPPAGTPPPGSGPAVLTLTNNTPIPGSALVVNSSAIGQITGTCSGNNAFTYGVDKKFCTADDPGSTFGSVQTLPQTTGMAAGLITNSYKSAQPGCDTDPTSAPCNIGPVITTGSPFSCSAIVMPTPSISGAGTVGAFVTVNLPTVVDSVVTNSFYFQ